MTSSKLELIALQDFPLIEPGDDIAQLILTNLKKNNLVLQEGDLLVVAQKIISKAENRYVYFNDVTVSAAAEQLALEVNKDPRLVQLILDESVEVVKKKPGVLIVEHRLGFVHANAGIDQSNIENDANSPRALLLPNNPDASAKTIRELLEKTFKVSLGIMINDSIGRAWRNGSCGMCIGLSGFEPVSNLIGGHDIFGNELRVTIVAIADELAAAASFLMGQAAERTPIILLRGANLDLSNAANTSSLIRHKKDDLFR